jgi:hypothetical protein
MWANDETHASRDDGYILHPSSRTLFRYWETARAERPAPARSELNLREISALVPNLFIIEHHAATAALRWRLAGTALCQIFRRELTGTSVLSGWDAFEADILRRFLMSVADTYQPAILRFRLHTDLGHEIGTELAAFPIIASDGATTHVFGGMFAFRDVAPLDYSAIRHMDISAARLIWTENLPGQPEQRTTAARPRLTVISGGLNR